MLKFTDTYTRYKQIEGEFIKWLKTASSSKNNKGGNAKWTTLSLKKAVNFIKDKAVYVPQHVFERLNEAINLRHETRVNLYNLKERRGLSNEGG